MGRGKRERRDDDGLKVESKGVDRRLMTFTVWGAGKVRNLGSLGCTGTLE